MILPLEKQVPTRETCRKLEDAGFPSHTSRQWFKLGPNAGWGLRTWGPQRAETAETRLLPAPTAAELGALLPRRLDGSYTLETFPLGDLWHVARYSRPKGNVGVEEKAKCFSTTEAEARALLWLSLHEKGLLPAASYSN